MMVIRKFGVKKNIRCLVSGHHMPRQTGDVLFFRFFRVHSLVGFILTGFK